MQKSKCVNIKTVFNKSSLHSQYYEMAHRLRITAAWLQLRWSKVRNVLNILIHLGSAFHNLRHSFANPLKPKLV
jgi:hypothetical protein